MAIRHLLKLAHRSPKTSRALTQQPFRSSSQLTPASETVPVPSSPPPTAMIYNRLAEQVQSKLERLENPDPKFLRYASPHPILSDHTSILSFPETKVTTLPNGLRVATESNLASRTATVGDWIDANNRFETDGTNGIAHFLEHI